jgi:hypothetical protein
MRRTIAQTVGEVKSSHESLGTCDEFTSSYYILVVRN